jgi:hypothetical protein
MIAAEADQLTPPPWQAICSYIVHHFQGLVSRRSLARFVLSLPSLRASGWQ